MKNITHTAELIKEEEGGYTVYCPELDIYTQGDDIEDAIKNLKEAAELHIEELGIKFKLGASPISSLCHCQAFTLSSLRVLLRKDSQKDDEAISEGRKRGGIATRLLRPSTKGLAMTGKKEAAKQTQYDILEIVYNG